ncbi:MAG: hypothetical protein ABIS50_00095 [Luteolibacter sp.]|uniref:hypothetical protein n=1 Tax=Luteolibacter sp. TaxID=1962973 RepID=UPI0032657853
MILRPLVLGLIVTALAAAQEIPRAVQVTEPPEPLKLAGQDRVISSTKQFRVNGGGSEDRSATVMLAEEARNELLRLTEDVKTGAAFKEPETAWWKIPISITLHGKSGDPLPRRTVATEILVSEAGFEIHLDVHLSRGIEQERLKFATTAALIYERTLKDRPNTVSQTPYLVPPWLVDGLREATAWRLNQSDRRLYEALFKTGGLFKLDDLFSLDERGFDDMDGASRAAFHVSSGALVMALLQQPQGKSAFRNFLAEVADFQGEMPALLRKHFPELNLSETSLSKWWQLQLANIGAQNLASDILTISKTDAMLAESLRLNFRDGEGLVQQKELIYWPEIAALPEAERANSVRLAQDALVRLSYRCFPSYRPILAEYQIILANIAKNKTKDVTAALTAIDERRATMTAKAARASDYLNWFEITRARETSGAFDDYLRLKERLKSNPHQRDDELSKYLDRLDAIFNRGLENTAPVESTPNGEIPNLPPLPK